MGWFGTADGLKPDECYDCNKHDIFTLSCDLEIHSNGGFVGGHAGVMFGAETKDSYFEASLKMDDIVSTDDGSSAELTGALIQLYHFEEGIRKLKVSSKPIFELEVDTRYNLTVIIWKEMENRDQYWNTKVLLDGDEKVSAQRYGQCKGSIGLWTMESDATFYSLHYTHSEKSLVVFTASGPDFARLWSY